MGWFFGLLIGLFVSVVGTGFLLRYAIRPLLERLYEAVRSNRDLVQALDQLFDQLAEEWPPEETKGGGAKERG